MNRCFRFDLIVLLNILCSITAVANKTVSISYPNFHYILQIPDNWDTIPRHVIKEKLTYARSDVGLYSTLQEDYFDGRYSLVQFLPTPNRVDRITLERIMKDVAEINKRSEINNDTVKVDYVDIYPHSGYKDGQYCIYSFFSIHMKKDTLQCCQMLYPVKFGYVSVLYYQKGAKPMDKEPEQLSEMIRIPQEFQYSEPQNKKITLRQILIALAIGLIVYGLILFLQNYKTHTA